MRVLVTGAGGFIGRATTERLIQDGHAVTALDRQPGRLRWPDVADVGGARLRLIGDDLLNVDLDELLADVDAVVHLAGRGNVRASWHDPGPYLRDNVEATDRLCRHVAMAERPRVMVLASSSSVYGGRLLPWSEESAVAPASPYGGSKLAAERVAEVRLAGCGKTLVTARLFSVYGPGQREDLLLSRLIDCALTGDVFTVHGDGTQRRDFTFIDDVVTCLMHLLHVECSDVLNVCTGASRSVLELVDLVGELTGRSLRISADQTTSVEAIGAAHTWGDNRKLLRMCGPLNWTPLRDGVARQIESQQHR
ncbi:NAD-dependent epimerase/dehydratase family protein [Plantactinospora sp. WMMC1484]|uniref:NAD-dependent epimerase/dehydratase family protein n=1 Tax=Plantactinospora sp. WMMC1484 TaxID=3404122 RepID=UPI003BF52B34